MDDGVYVRRLFEILTNPRPTGIDPDDPYGQADDGIDRYDGFGRDVWVRSMSVVDGEHGAEAAVEFELVAPPRPDLQGPPHRGFLQVPVELEWRQLSGYADPAAYAPVVAWAVERAARSYAERHLAHRSDSVDREEDRRVLPGREEQWRLLLAALSAEGTVHEVGSGRIAIASSDGTVVTIVVSADQWEVVLRKHAWGDVDLYVAELLGPRQADEVFVIFHRDDLWRSTREKPPPVPGSEWRRRGTPPGR